MPLSMPPMFWGVWGEPVERQISFYFKVVRTAGIEPAWPKPRDFKSLASTGSATSASLQLQALR